MVLEDAGFSIRNGAYLAKSSHFFRALVPLEPLLLLMQGRSQKSSEGGAKIVDRKPHPLINAETGSNCYSVRVPANNYVKQ